MKVATEVRKKIDQIEDGTIFKYKDLEQQFNNSMALAKILSRLVKENKIERIEKGIFYKTKKTRFGNLNPDTIKIIKKELEINEDTKGYITGGLIYNNLGLTTQIPNTIEVAVNKRKPQKIINGSKVKYIQTMVPIKKENVKYLQLLDTIKNIKKIPDSNINESYKILRKKILELSENEKIKLLKLAMNYSPMTRALIGALLEETTNLELDILENSLNKLTKFDIKISLIKNKKRWNIK
jgi:predicted transcriptional regulator of viral defense system